MPLGFFWGGEEEGGGILIIYTQPTRSTHRERFHAKFILNHYLTLIKVDAQQLIDYNALNHLHSNVRVLSTRRKF